MKKKLIHGLSHDLGIVRKIWLTMRLIVLLFFVSLVHVSASVYSQKTKLSIKVENATLQQLFDLIQDQSEFDFFYKNEQIPADTRVSVDAKNETIESILNNVLKDTGLKYGLVDKDIVIIPIVPEALSQQQNKVSGKVTDNAGVSLPGVSVVVKGTTNGVITDNDGKFSLANIPENAILQFSFLGMKTQDIAISGKTSINVVMKEDAVNIEEVVAVGYGTVKKSDLTGSVSSMTSNDIKKTPVLIMSQAIQGRLAGVVVGNNSGAPGGNIKIRIRGANSMNGSNEPLYIVDGIALNIGINSINVNDIESVEVLKDASSTAVYGSRGANGVMLITTKHGISEATQVQLTVNTGVSNLMKKYDLLDAGSFADLVNIYKPNYFSSSDIADYKKNGGVDWQDEVFRTGITQDYQLNLKGGSVSKYYISANYINQTGIVTGTDMTKYSVRSNIDTEFLKKFKFNLSTFASRAKFVNDDDNGYKGGPIWNTPLFPPTFPIYTKAGQWNRLDNLSGPGLLNPLMVLKERYSDNISSSIGLNSKLSYKITEDLNLEILFGADNNSTQRGTITNKWINVDMQSASLNEAKIFSWQNSNILTYHKKFSDIHDLTVMAANEQSQFTYNGFGANGANLNPIDVIGYDNLSLANSQSISSYRSQSSLLSFLGRASYSLMNKYLITASYRADGTSKFQGNNKWGYFPSAAIAWRVSEESFFKNNSFINGFKLRGSWGLTGNQGIDAYATIAKIGIFSNTYGGPVALPGSIIVGADNPDLKWETTDQINLGADISVLKGKLNLTVDLYEKNTSDLLYSSLIPLYNGGGTVNKNIGEMVNKGYEITISGKPISKNNFQWDASFNISSYKNKLLSLGIDTFYLGGNYASGLTSESPFAIKVGESLGSFWGYEWEGVYKTVEASEAAKYGFKPGDNKYKDWNKDGVITSKDKHIIGNAMPKIIWGFENTFSYKNFDLYVMIQGLHGRKILNTVYAASTTILSDASAISHVDGLNYWTPNNENASFANPSTSTGKNFIESTQFLQDGSYMKVKNVALTYNVSKRIIKFADLKLTLSAQNLLTFTQYKGYDPESSTSSNDIDGAIDVGAYPNARSITFGIQLNF